MWKEQMSPKYLRNLNNSLMLVDFSVSPEDKANFDNKLAKVNMSSWIVSIK